MHPSAHVSTFCRDNLPPPELWPTLLLDPDGSGGDLSFPPQLNCVEALLDDWVARGEGGRLCVQGYAHGAEVRWTYADLSAEVSRIAHALIDDLGVLPGERVLLRGPNTPALAACWLAIVKVGAVAVATMPLLRARELGQVIRKAEVRYALCDERLLDELERARADCPTLTTLTPFLSHAPHALDTLAAPKPTSFKATPTASDDVCLIAFTSGTTGEPKGTMHFHRDIIAACRCWPPQCLQPTPSDIFIGSPPLAFTFGLGGLLLFPLSAGASTVLIERATPDALLEATARYSATVMVTAPTAYRAMAPLTAHHDLSALRRCVSAGEALPAATRALWRERTGVEMIDGIGSTELLHIFISHTIHDARPGATGRPVRGYEARVVDEEGNPLPPNTIGRLAVRGPTGCRYLADERQRGYVQGGWNLTGDAYLIDEDGYFIYQARTDDMIISGGYNIAGPEVESALLAHEAVAECGVIGAPDEERGQIVKAFVVLRPGHAPTPELARALQEFVKSTVAPYKYPRSVVFCDALPRTETGKLQRFKLRGL
jgi:2-aminobenzoate-CoA ligase